MEALIEAVSEVKISYLVLAFAAVVGLLAIQLSGPKVPGPFIPKISTIEIGLAGHLFISKGLGLRIFSLLRRRGGSFWGLTSSHQVVRDLPNQEKLLAHGGALLGFPRDWNIAMKVFGVPKLEICHHFLESQIKFLLVISERLFVNDAASTAAIERADVPGKADRLVTFSNRPEAQERWEQLADIKVISPDSDGKLGVVEANLLHLIRDFGSCIAIPQLYGQDFLDRNPTLLKDFWQFDNELFPMLIVGVPSWLPLKIMRDGLAARSRLHDALRGVHRRTSQFVHGQPVDGGVDMSDVGSVTLGRCKAMDEAGLPEHLRGRNELGNLWAQNANTQPLAFWLILHIYADAELLSALREEVLPFLRLSRPENRTPEITSFSMAGLYQNCPLLKGALYEVYRVYNCPTAVRYVSKDMNIEDGGGLQHKIQKGTWLSFVYYAINKDADYFPAPDEFRPDRFLETDPGTGAKVPRYGKLRPWGSGHGMCKGRVFAEKEILSMAAAIITLWNIEPLGDKWEIPASRPGTGACKPVRDVRVRIKRRIF